MRLGIIKLKTEFSFASTLAFRYLCNQSTFKARNTMFAKETYVQRRAQLKKTVGSGVLLFLGNDEQGLN